MKGLVLLGRTSGVAQLTWLPLPQQLIQDILGNTDADSSSQIFQAYQRVCCFFFSLLFFPFSAPWILNRDLLMSNKHKNASLSSFAAKARMIIKLNPGHMAWVLLLETSPGSDIEGGINPWQENRENRAVPHSSLCQRGRNSCPQCHRGVGHTQDCHIPSAWRNCLWKHIPSTGQGVGGREGAEGQRQGKL